jgi:superfamily I DNA and/or RNA helicase
MTQLRKTTKLKEKIEIFSQNWKTQMDYEQQFPKKWNLKLVKLRNGLKRKLKSEKIEWEMKEIEREMNERRLEMEWDYIGNNKTAFNKVVGNMKR